MSDGIFCSKKWAGKFDFSARAPGKIRVLGRIRSSNRRRDRLDTVGDNPKGPLGKARDMGDKQC
ncbi:MAG: hypothetical protein AAFN80_08770 [Pseudomonadota bacterium]